MLIAANKDQSDRDSGSTLLWRKLVMRATPFGVGMLKEDCLIFFVFFLGFLGESEDMRSMLPIAGTAEIT